METYIAVVILLLRLRSISGQLCDTCDCSLSDNHGDTRSVRHVKLFCNDGVLTWKNPFGAVRLEISPSRLHEFQFCFKINTGYSKMVISQEIPSPPPNAKSPASRTSYFFNDSNLKTLITAEGKTKEYCVTAESMLTLFIERAPGHGTSPSKEVMIQYVVEKIPSQTGELEVCRPCKREELLKAYCASDFVVVGSMRSLSHDDTHMTTTINVDVSQIIQQKGTLFRRETRHSKTLQGTLQYPRKCGITFSKGLLLFTGSVRLSQLQLQCAPNLEEWMAVAKQAETDGSLLCDSG